MTGPCRSGTQAVVAPVVSPRTSRPRSKILLAVPQGVLVGILISTGGEIAILAAAVLALDLFLHAIPWPTRRREAPTYVFVAESIAYNVPMVGLFAFLVSSSASWAEPRLEWWWFLPAIAIAGALTYLSGLHVPALIRGDLAFLRGPEPLARPISRAGALIAGSVGEEASFRGAGIFLFSGSVDGIIAGLAFVARHHIRRGRGWPRVRPVLLEILAAVSFGTLAVIAGSIYPSMLAHALTNVPRIVLEGQILFTGLRRA